jgi:hypothetical protein
MSPAFVYENDTFRKLEDFGWIRRVHHSRNAGRQTETFGILFRIGRLCGIERFSANLSERHLNRGGVLPAETLVTLLIAQSAALLLHVNDVWHSPNASHLGIDALGIAAQVGLS